MATILDTSPATVSRIYREALQRVGRTLSDRLDIPYSFEPHVDRPVVVAIRGLQAELIAQVAQEPDWLHRITPRDFERMVAEIFTRFGFRVELTMRTRDGGCDVIGFKPSQVGIETKYIIECKRYAEDCPVQVRAVRALYGIKDVEQAQHLILATTSYFTRDAIGFAMHPSVYGLHLKDHKDIMSWLRAYRKAINDGGVILDL